MPAPLKDRLDRALIDAIADHLQAAYPRLKRAEFRAVSRDFGDLELKDRVAAVADRMRDVLPSNYPEALDIVVEASRGPLGEFGHWPYTTFVERHGLDHPTQSLEAMETLTRQWSCEFAIRPFLDLHQDETLRAVMAWARHPDARVRRLASEGTRPLLPWGPGVRALTADPMIGLRVLEELRHDESETVRRSVANHLNDVAKAEPDLVAATLSRWTADGNKNGSAVDEWMVRHALRTMIKRGHPGALALLGFTVDAQVQVERFRVTPKCIALGDTIEVAATMTSTSPEQQRLVVDFIIHHPTASGSISAKVFKWTVVELAPDAQVELRKTRKIQTASTRRYTAGEHRIELQVAGAVLATTSFHLEQSSPRASTR